MRINASNSHFRALLYLNLLERVFKLIVLPHNNLPLLLRAHMFHPHLLRQLRRIFANEARIPEFARNTQVFAAAHEGV